RFGRQQAVLALAFGVRLCGRSRTGIGTGGLLRFRHSDKCRRLMVRTAGTSPVPTALHKVKGADWLEGIDGSPVGPRVFGRGPSFPPANRSWLFGFAVTRALEPGHRQHRRHRAARSPASTLGVGRLSLMLELQLSAVITRMRYGGAGVVDGDDRMGSDLATGHFAG